MRKTILLLLITGAATLALSGCGSDPASPGIQPEVVNNTDSFGYQVSNVENFTGTQRFTWSNSGNAANVNQATFRSKGTGVVRFIDANSQQVVALPLGENGSFDALPGATGDWTISVEYSGFTGTVNFRAEKTAL